MSIAAAASYTGLADGQDYGRAHPRLRAAALDPSALTGLRYLGMDEVPRAKGHDYLTIVYDP